MLLSLACALQFVNNYFMLFYIAFIRDYLSEASIAATEAAVASGNADELAVDFGDARVEIAHSTLPELQAQLAIVFTGKTLAKSVAHALKPFFVKWSKSAISFYRRQQFNRDEKARQERDPNYVPRSALEDLEAAKSETSGMTTYERQAHLMPYEGTFDDFNDRVIQFGYIVLFAPAYPLAPFLAFVNNIVEIRLGGYKMCSGYQRPRWSVRQGIGSWLGMLSVLGFAAVVTNSLMVAFVGSESATRSVGDDGDKNLFIVTDDENKTACDPDTYLPAGATLADIMNGNNPHCTVGTFSDRLEQWSLWWRFVLIEHVCMCVRVVIMTVSPTYPDWVRDAQDTLTYR